MNLPPIYSGKRRRLFAWLLANAAAQAGVLFCNAMLIRYTFDHFIHRSGVDRSAVLWLGLAVALCALAKGWLHGNERIAAEKLGQSYIHNLRMRLFRQVSRMDPRHLQKRRRGAVMLKFIGDLNALRRWVSFGIVRILVSGAVIIATLGIMFMIDWVLSAVTALLIGTGIVMTVRIGESLRSVAKDTRRRRSRLSGNINEKLARMSVVQVFGRREHEIRRVRRQSANLKKALILRAAKIGQIRGVTYGVAALAVAAVLFTGVFQVMIGKTTPGTVAAAMVVIGFLAPALKNLGRVYEYYQDAVVARQKLTRFMKIRTTIKWGSNRPHLQPGPGRLKLEHITVDNVFEDVCVEAQPGQVIAVVGPNGAGKSVLMDLIARLVSPDKGKIYIDGQDIATVNLDSVRRRIGIVSPDLPLLAGSLEMNLGYRRPGSTPSQCEAIRQLCGIDTLIDQLPRGKETRILEGGRNLSLGQRQRILLARALMGQPSILLLDEVDAHLDHHARQVVSEVIRTFNGTVLWVTHRQIPLLGVDAVWRINDGTIKMLDASTVSGLQRAAG